MRRILAVIFLIVLASCTTEVLYQPDANIHVYNSAWEKVAEATVRDAMVARGVDSALTLEEFVADYNATHTDDQLILLEGEEVPIELAPDAPAWIVNASTLAVYWSDIVKRADLESRRDAWRMSVEAMADPATGQLVPCILYVDKIPPEPPVIEPPAPKLWVALVWVTEHEVYWSEKYPTEAEAIVRWHSLDAQRELNELGLGMGEGDWMTYLGEEEFAW